MIEVVASMARGPVFLAGELMECLITFTNPMSHLSTSASRYGFTLFVDTLLNTLGWPWFMMSISSSEFAL